MGERGAKDAGVGKNRIVRKKEKLRLQVSSARSGRGSRSRVVSWGAEV